MSYIDDECNECMLYVKHKCSTKGWTCHYCELIEPPIHKHRWDYYELPCGHFAHIRCYRVWCKTVDKVGCKTCGLLERVTENLNCYYCKNFGHDANSCPVNQHINLRGYIAALWSSY